MSIAKELYIRGKNQIKEWTCKRDSSGSFPFLKHCHDSVQSTFFKLQKFPNSGDASQTHKCRIVSFDMIFWHVSVCYPDLLFSALYHGQSISSWSTPRHSLSFKMARKERKEELYIWELNKIVALGLKAPYLKTFNTCTGCTKLNPHFLFKTHIFLSRGFIEVRVDINAYCHETPHFQWQLSAEKYSPLFVSEESERILIAWPRSFLVLLWSYSCL